MRTKMFTVLAVLAAFVILTLSGCASFNAAGRMPDFNDPSSVDKTKLSTKMDGDVFVTVYPLKVKEEVEKYFDEDLIDAGILAIMVDVDCSMSTTLAAATLVLEDGISVSQMSAEEVYATMKRGYGLRTVAGWFFGLYIGAPILAYQTYKTNEKIQQDLNGTEGVAGKLLKLGKFQSGKTKGFLCFRVDNPVATKKLQLIFQRDGKLTEYDFDVN